MPSLFRGFSVAILPVDSKTTNLPLPLIPPAKDSEAEFDNWAITESTCPNVVVANRLKTIIADKRKVRRIVTNFSKVNRSV